MILIYYIFAKIIIESYHCKVLFMMEESPRPYMEEVQQGSSMSKKPNADARILVKSNQGSLTFL